MTTAPSQAPGAGKLDPAVVKLAIVLVLGGLAPLLDTTIVNVAVGTLGRRLHASVTTVQWVSTGYLLAQAAVIPVSGWCTERFGARRMWLGALALFLAGSVLCGLSGNIGVLITFRVLQGLGGGMMLPILQTVLLRATSGQSLGKLMAVVTLPALIGPICGPVIGGLIVGHLAWQWIFFVNVPVCLVAIAAAWRRVPNGDTRTGHRLDVPGLLLLSPALALIIYGLSRIGGSAGAVEVAVPLVAGAALLAGFVVRALRGRGEPLIQLRVFRSRAFAAASALLFSSGLAMFGALLILPLYYQQVRGADVVTAGLLLAPQGLGSLLARGAGSLTDRIGPRPVVLAGLLATLLGTVPFALAGPHTSEWLLAAALVVRGAGLSAANLAVMAGAYSDLARAEIPHATSATRIMQQVGGSFGAAVLAVILQNLLTGHSTAAAYAGTFWWTIGFGVLAFVPALLLPARRTAVGALRAGPGRTGR